MPDRPQAIVTNTTPLIALTAATGSLEILRFLYTRVRVPYEVAQEIRVGGKDAFALDMFAHATWLDLAPAPVVLSPYLNNSLDRGEAAVIQTALNDNLDLVCIDEVVGRRIARLSGLRLTDSIGILLKAKQLGFTLSIPDALAAMRKRGIWLSERVIRFALEQDSQGSCH
jgi:predicted nucleic acid-binding protein